MLGQYRVLVPAVGFLALCLSIFSVGCTAVPLKHPATGATASTNVTRAESILSWEKVLQTAVSSNGQINFKKVASAPEDLNRFLSFISRINLEGSSPSFPERNEALAFFINSYNAMALAGIIHQEFPESLASLYSRTRFFKLMTFKVSGRSKSLSNYLNNYILPMKEPRLYFVLNNMTRSSPRLPQKPITAHNLDKQLDHFAREFFNSKKHVRIDPKNKIVYFSKILDIYRDEFVNDDASPNLIDFANRFRNKPIDESFEIEFIPFDWTVNYDN